MKLYINIDRAVEHYKRVTGKKLTLAQLGKVVFKGERLSTNSQEAYLSQWNNGQALQRCKIVNFIRISEFTGLPLAELIQTK